MMSGAATRRCAQSMVSSGASRKVFAFEVRSMHPPDVKEFGHPDLAIAPLSDRSLYESIGVRPIINCGSVRTYYGNSLMSEAVQLAMREASDHFVLLDELAEGVGRRLAELTGAEWGIVTAGSAAGLALAAAACIAGNDPERILRRP